MTPTGKDYDPDLSDGESDAPLAWEWRVMVVSAVWALHGMLFGALLRLCIPEGGSVVWWMTGTAILAAIFGGLLEADHLIG